MATIPIMRPLLPSTERLAPYLRRIDEKRIYSNYGPLAVSLEQRLAAHFALADGSVTTVANGTLGLSLALAAQDARPGTLCVLPAWTFVASVHAVLLAGLSPFFVDVDPQTWALDPGSVGDLIARAPAQVGAVMAVAPFGQPVDIAAWDAWRARTALPVVIDAAAGFDALVPGQAPAVVSLHAAKALGVGEGGFVVSADRSLIGAIRARANFGFKGAREAMFPAINGKLSEYHAAVGHAALDEWPQARAQWLSAATGYRNRLARSNRLRFQIGFGHSWVSSTCVVQVEQAARCVEAALADAAVATRRWWGDGAHAHAATRAFPRLSLPATEALAQTTISIPFFRDLAEADVTRVGEVILAAVAAGH
jgi:dTDP-4-amino-4,6-dideoxygalactose transaminase